MPNIVVTNTGISGASAGAPTSTGTAFIAARTDAGPPTTGPTYVRCQSINDYTTAFGQRSATSATAYDWLDEFFHDGGQQAYVVREVDNPNTAVKATLTLNDSFPHPTVLITAATPGVAGNNTNVVAVAGTAATFTGNTTNASVSVTNVSSFANIGVGTLVTGTGIPANTYVATVTPGTSTLTLTTAATATASAVVITPGTITINLQDPSGNLLETHGPYATTALLYADLTSTYVVFSQSALGGFTPNLPVASAAAPLTGGLNSSGLTDATAVTGLATFPSTLGPGTVALPARTTLAAWQGIGAHCLANNRFGVLDMVDSATVSVVTTAAATLGTPNYASYLMFMQGSLTLPGITPGTTRTAAGSSAVAALRAQVASTASQNQAPAGSRWPLRFPLAFTTFYGPAASPTLPAGSYLQADVNALSAVGVNVFANYYGTPCLFGFVSPVAKTTDLTYWQATAACERMALTAECASAMAPFLFVTIDGANIATTALSTALKAVIQRHWSNKALYGDSASTAGDVLVGPPINTPATAALGQLNAQVQARISPYADTVNLTITTVPITQAVV